MGRKPKTGEHGEYMPSQAEIRAACLEYQKEWTDHERRRRAGIRRADYEAAITKRIRGWVEEPVE